MSFGDRTADLLHALRERAVDVFHGLREDAEDWCEGKNPWGRWPLLLYLAYATVRHLGDPLYRSWFAGITLVLHELGHLLFAAFGQTLMLLGGSITQLAAPALAGAFLLLRRRDWFGLAVCLAWLSFSTFELATYVADANQGNLPLVGFGSDPLHDWEVLLTRWRVLNHCKTFAAVLRVGAATEALLALGLGGWLLVTMHRRRPRPIV